MKNLNKKTILKYLYDQLTGNFMGFVIGASATGLASQFFETRSMKNLWGLTAKKTVVNKETFHEVEWVISIVVGFIVFEIVTKIIKENLEKKIPTYKRMAYRYIINNDLHHKYRLASAELSGKGTVFFSAVHLGMKQAFNRLLLKGK